MGREVQTLNIQNHIHLLQNEQSQPTCLHKRHGTTSRPDLTFVPADIHNKTNIKIMDDISSNHLPILTTTDLRQKNGPVPRGKPFATLKRPTGKHIEKKLILSLKISTKTNLSNNSTYLYAAQYMQQQRKLFHKATVKNSRPSGHQK